VRRAFAVSAFLVLCGFGPGLALLGKSAPHKAAPVAPQVETARLFKPSILKAHEITRVLAQPLPQTVAAVAPKPSPAVRQAAKKDQPKQRTALPARLRTLSCRRPEASICRTPNAMRNGRERSNVTLTIYPSSSYLAASPVRIPSRLLKQQRSGTRRPCPMAARLGTLACVRRSTEPASEIDLYPTPSAFRQNAEGGRAR
jgi:hypothetical protein